MEIFNSEVNHIYRYHNRGVPLNKMRPVLLEMFKRTYLDNELEYSNTLKAIFGEEIKSKMIY